MSNYGMYRPRNNNSWRNNGNSRGRGRGGRGGFRGGRNHYNNNNNNNYSHSRRGFYDNGNEYRNFNRKNNHGYRGGRGRGGMNKYNNNYNHRNNNGHYGHHGHHNHRGNGNNNGRSNDIQKSMVRFHDYSNDGLNREILDLNKDHPGPQQIRVEKYCQSPWERVESLTKGSFYYHNRIDKKHTKIKPSELKEEQPIKTEYRPYTVPFVQRPKEWPRKMPTIILKTNSFQVRGKILETWVHQFEVTFEPLIKSELVTLREKVVLGSNLKEKKKNYQILREKFGEFQFDNHALYSMGVDKPSDAIILNKLHNDYTVTFHCIDSFRLSDPTIPIQQQEALLNIFNRKRLQKTGFSRIGRGWFKKGYHNNIKSSNNNNNNSRHNNNNRNNINNNENKMQEISIVSSSSSCPDVNIIHGFECSMRILPKNGNQQLTVFKADLAHKLVERLTLYDRLILLKRKFGLIHDNNSSNNNKNNININPEILREFRIRAEKEFKKRHFLLIYNKRNLQISDIDWNQNENSMFQLQTGGKISYKNYLLRQYNIKSPKHEMCVIKDKGGAVFLPQHIRLTITSKQSDLIYDEVLNFVNPRTDERLNRIENFVQHINSNKDIISSNSTGNNNINNNNNEIENINMDFEIDEDSLNTPAFVLKMPNIIIKGEHGPMQAQPVDDFKYFQTRGFLKPINGNIRQLRNWVVIFEPKHEKSFECFLRSWETYIKKRHFHPINGPLCKPQYRIIKSLNNEMLYNKVVKQNDELIVVILPDGMRGSEVKAKFTKVVQQMDFPNPCLVQCIQNQTCRKTNACLGTFEDIMIKFGNVPYRIDPCLYSNSNKYIDINSTWVWGIDVSHVTNKPSVVMVSISRDPFEGSLRSMHFITHLNPSRKEIVAFNNMINLSYKCIIEAYNATKKENKRLPLSIIIFRDGVADGQIPELFTKEVCGIQRAFTIFREKYKLKKWRPKLEYILCNKNTIDRFGLLDQRTGLCRSLNKPCVIYDHILSDRLWDFIIFPYHFKKNSDRTKGVRYIVLLDQLELHKNGINALDLFQFIFGLTYMFAFSVPFPLGGTAQPAPIVYAKHYAESFSQSILNTDKSINDLKTNPKLFNRPHVVTQCFFNTNNTNTTNNNDKENIPK